MPIIPLEELKEDKEVRARLLQTELTFKTTWGLFCPEEIDQGTKLLLEHLPSIKDGAHVLDIGCGYGPIGIAIASKLQSGTIDMIDKDFVAVEYTKKNIDINKKHFGDAQVQTYLSNGFSHVDQKKKYDLIVSNLPAKVSKEFFWILFGEAFEHLETNGEFVVVAIRQLEPMLKKSFEAVFGNFEVLGTDKVYSVVRTKKLV
ncbi:MAG: class I SAM-dependent methyltransferase [Candidatus Taylorbacteria bacterium]|nr:class I SAM-dependent methyltransferase [Candidatus Taylorbacteria bacterium]